jgi:hypothetical protein
MLLIALVLVGIFAFTAEPTTSTEADIAEGRAHGAFFHAGSVGARTAHSADAGDELATLATVAVLAALVALLLASPSTIAVVARTVRDGSRLRWATTARRGPPARAY